MILERKRKTPLGEFLIFDLDLGLDLVLVSLTVLASRHFIDEQELSCDATFLIL